MKIERDKQIQWIGTVNGKGPFPIVHYHNLKGNQYFDAGFNSKSKKREWHLAVLECLGNTDKVIVQRTTARYPGEPFRATGRYYGVFFKTNYQRGPNGEWILFELGERINKL